MSDSQDKNTAKQATLDRLAKWGLAKNLTKKEPSLEGTQSRYGGFDYF